VRTGLELVAAIGGLTTHAPLHARVGIATGLVVVSDLVGKGEAQERGIVGATFWRRSMGGSPRVSTRPYFEILSYCSTNLTD
jgi:hypothetical protein